MSSKSLQPIYMALESHQYSRAVKLCLTQQSSPINRALLAHAYAKSSQRAKALATIQNLFLGGGAGAAADSSSTVCFPELQLELKYAVALEEEPELAASNQHQSAQQQQQQTAGGSASKKPGKKGKKKGLSAAAGAGTSPSSLGAGAKKKHLGTLQPSSVVPSDWDLIDQLDTPPQLPKDWEQQLPAANVITPDPTLLATLSMTMTGVLHLPLTAYQLYCWALTCDHLDASEELLYTRRAFLLGLAVPHYHQQRTVGGAMLANMQVLALQLARLQKQYPAEATPQYPATLWAAQTALWQVEYYDDHNSDQESIKDEKQTQRLAMLPRLAESLASKCVEEYSVAATATTDDTAMEEGGGGGSGNSLLPTESFLLYMKTLDRQGKWTEKLAVLEERLAADNDDANHDRQMSPPRQSILELKVATLRNLDPVPHDAVRVTVEELLGMFPDDWEYWKQHLECCIAEADGDVERGCVQTDAFVTRALRQAEQNQGSRTYPLRGPHLMRVELAATRLGKLLDHRRTSPSAVDCDALTQSILVYGEEFAPRATCAFSDLHPYLELALDLGSAEEQARALLEWSSKLRSRAPSSDDTRERRKELRTYIFAVQVNYTVLHKFEHLQREELPPWEELMTVWKTFQAFELAKNVDQAQKESRPADELVLLAVQRILCENPGTVERMTALCLLEAAIRYSPYNAYLKISAMFVYSDLNAASRSWELYNELYIKHIQNESCSYLILPLLLSGGLYGETIHVCQEIMGLQRNSLREAGDFSAKAMENGAASKAEEFLVFQRERMTKSLTTLEAKGLILDCAPMLVSESEGELGAAHGIVGGDADLERVKQMIAEAHNPSGAFTLLRQEEPDEVGAGISENRDFGILSFELLVKRDFDSVQRILGESTRRGHLHNLLIRAALCVDASKGPKKGKATKASTELEKRCKSLLRSVERASESFGISVQSAGYRKYCEVLLSMCRAIAALSAGMNPNGESVYATIDAREEAVEAALKDACESLRLANGEFGLSEDRLVSKTCHLLSDCVAPVFALFQMCAKLVDLYGWGRRKLKTKRCAAAVAEMSTTLLSLISDMKASVARLPEQAFAFDQETNGTLANFIEEDVVKLTCAAVLESQRCTRGRLEPLLSYLQTIVESFTKIDE